MAANAGLGSIDRLADESVRSACNAGFRVLKLKVGVASIDHEIKHLQPYAGW